MADKQPLSEQIGFRVSPTTKAALERLAAAEHRSLSQYLNLVIMTHVAAKEAEANQKSKRK